MRGVLTAALALVSVLPAAAQAQAITNAFDYTRSSSFTYYAASDGVRNGLLKSEIIEADTAALCVQTSYTYDAWGNKASSTAANCAGASGDALFTARTASQTWSRGTQPSVTLPDGRVLSLQAGQFPLDSLNALSQASSQLFDPRFGAPTQYSDPNGQITRATYDELGRKTQESKPDGGSQNWRYCILGGRGLDTSTNSGGCVSRDEAPPDAVQYVQSWPTAANGAVSGPWTIVFNDRMGRQLRRVTQSFNGPSQPAAQSGSSIVQDDVYNAWGVKELSSQPYWLATGGSTTSDTNNAGATKVVVDALGRPTQIYTADGKGTRGGIVFGAASFAGWGAYGSRQASLVAIAYAGGKTITSTYYKATDAGGEQVQNRTQEKNPAGEVVRITDHTGAQLIQQPDAFGVLRYTKDALGNAITVDSDVRGRKVKLIDADTGPVKYSYNALGELVSQSNAKQNTKLPATSTRMAYDQLGRLTQRIDDEYTSNWYYDKDAGGASCRSSGSSAGHLCESTTSHGVRRRYWFDAVGRPTSDRMDVTGGISAAQSYQWDANTSRLTKRTWPTGLAVAYDYTTLGYLSQMRLAQSATINPLPSSPGGAAGASANWAAAKVIWRAEIVDAWGHSERHSTGESADPTSVTTRTQYDGVSSRLLNRWAGLSAGTALLNLGLGYDNLGRVNTRQDRNGSGDGIVVSETFSYDSLDRLVNYTAAHPAIASGQREVKLTYNAVGQLLKRSDLGAYDYTVVAGQTASQPHALKKFTDLAGNVTQYSYDVDGNMNKALRNGSTCQGKYCWADYNSFNQLDSNLGIRGPVAGGAGSPRYTWQYDETHARIKETRLISGTTPDAGTRTTWRLHPDNQGGLGFEYEVDAPKVPSAAYPQTQQSRHYIMVGAQVVAVMVSDSALPTLGASDKTPPSLTALILRKVEYWHVDHLGSLIATSDHQGAATARYSYDPFGQRRSANGVADPNQAIAIDWDPALNAKTGNGYTGHEHLDDVGIVHMNGRVFDARLGIFLQPDPMLQDPGNLQNYHRYGYVYNNPLNLTDPSGLCFMGCFWQPKTWNPYLRMVVAMVAAYYGQQWASAELMAAGYTSVATIGGGAVGGFAAGAINSGNLKGALQGAFSGAVFAGVGDYLNNTGAFNGFSASAPGEFSATGIALHGVAGCVTSVVGGGKCGPGALSAAFSQAATPLKQGLVQGTIVSMVVGGTASVLGGGKFENGAMTAAFGYLFNCAAHGCQQKVDELSQKLSNEQSATTLRFFNPADQNPLAPDQITGPAMNLSADYIVTATEIQEVANGVKPFAGQVTPPTGFWGTVWNGVQSIFGAGKAEVWQWSSDIDKFTKQLTDRFGAAARNGVSNAFRTRYEELKSGG